jgi:hypothetical protein
VAVTSPPAGGTTTYETPFQITFTVETSSGDPALPSATPVTLQGVLSTENIGGVNTLTAGFDSGDLTTVGSKPGLPPYRITEGGGIVYGIYPTSYLVSLVPTSQNGGVFNLEADLDVYSTPEPTPLALLFTTSTGISAGTEHEDRYLEPAASRDCNET